MIAIELTDTQARMLRVMVKENILVCDNLSRKLDCPRFAATKNDYEKLLTKLTPQKHGNTKEIKSRRKARPT